MIRSLIAAAALAIPIAPHALAGPAEEAVVEGYVEEVVNGRAVERIDAFVAEDLMQHNPNLPDGREALAAFWTGFLSEMPDARFTVGRLISEGDLVVQHSLFQAHEADAGMAVVDIYRVVDGLIVEHWDVAAPIPETFASGRHPVLAP